MMATTTITAEPGVPFIDITREFDAPRSLLYRAFTEPELMSQWLGPRKYVTDIQANDVRDGGTWRFIHRDDTGAAYGFRGVFHGTPSPDGILRTFEYEGAPGHVALESVLFEEHDGRTTVRTHSVYQSLEDRDAMIESGMESGVNEGYDRLDELVARSAAPVA